MPTCSPPVARSRCPRICRRTVNRVRFGVAVGATCITAIGWAQTSVIGTLREINVQACRSAQPEQWLGALPGAAVARRRPIEINGQPVGERVQIELANGDAIHIERVAPKQQLRRLTLQYDLMESGHRRPWLLVISRADCEITHARRMLYADDGYAYQVEELARDLHTPTVAHLLNPPLTAGVDPGGILVGIVDSGVNYLLPEVAARLARDREGVPLGFDYWDLDARPFDANPARSAFFPQRHGTQTATLLIAESPVARIVPYRYPRPDMSRMKSLIENAATRGVRIMNLSLGSRRFEEWRVFETAARVHPEILFITSAGNEGQDIDSQPVYPAAFDLPNLITVTSADDDGRQPAPGANWGAQSVDLMVPAENMIVTDFDGHARLVSGSSYAAVRVSALAACLLDRNRQWSREKLKAMILALAQPESASRFVRYGSLPDPIERQRGSCAPDPEFVRVNHVYPVRSAPLARARHQLTGSFVVIRNTRWTVAAVRRAVHQAASILGQCGIAMAPSFIHVVDGPGRVRYYHNSTAHELARALDVPRPTVFFLKDTLQREAFEGEAIGRANSRDRPLLRNTVWMIEDSADPGIALAHELFHLVTDSGRHSDDQRNLMHAETEARSVTLSADQCRRAVTQGVENGLLVAR